MHWLMRSFIVAMSMPIVLSRQQCSNRYSVLTSTKNTGKWSLEEDELLEKLVDEVPEGANKRWKIISERMGSRTDRQCRQRSALFLFRNNRFLTILRWNGVLDKSVKRGDWSEEEDQALRAALEASDKPDPRELAGKLNRPTLMVR